MRPEHPANLAALRISVSAILLASPETYAAERLARLPAVIRTFPEGLGWASALPITPALGRISTTVLVVGACAGLAGLFSRVALVVVTLSGLYVFGIYQLTGSVTHDMHLLWFSALLAASPCGHALSLDALLARRRGAPPPRASVDVAVTLTAVRILLGLVYFFPGLWKLRESGLAWVSGDNLRNQMYWKWYENGAVPPLRVDGSDALLHAGALGVVAFELSFLPLVLFRRTRLLAALGGVAFHLATQVFLFIPFVSLWGCYTALVDWSRFARRTPVSPAGAGDGAGPTAWPTSAVVPAVAGAVLSVSVAVQGFRNAVQAWPVACYPTFQSLAPPTIPDLVLEAIDADGRDHVLPDGPGAGGRRAPEDWALAWRVAGLYGERPTDARLRGYYARALEKPAVRAARGAAVRVRIYRAWYSVAPRDRGKAPVRAELIGEIPAR